MRAIQLSHGVWIASAGDSEAGGQIDRNAAQVMDGFDTIRMAWEKKSPDFHHRFWGNMTEDAQRELSSVRWARQTVFAGFGNTAVYPPFLYLPSMAGWRVGEALNFTIVESLRLARLFSAWSAVVLGWLALRLSLTVRWPLFACLLLPSTLFLNASCSQDAVLLSVAVLVTALVSRGLDQRRAFTTRELAGVSCLVALICMARPPYLPLVAVLLLPDIAAGKRRRFRSFAAVLFIVVTVLLWHTLVASLGLDTADEADPAKQILYLRHFPVAAAMAVLHGTWTALLDFWQRGLYVLGWDDLLAPWPMRFVEVLCLVAVFLTGFAPRREERLILFAVVGSLLAISLAEYLIWTPPGLATVYGVQPRYWLPVLPFAALLVRDRPRFARVSATAGGVLVLLACSVPLVAARMFYLEGLMRVLRFNF